MHRNKRVLKHLFIPHRGNAFRPHALRHNALAFYSLALIGCQLLLGVTLLSGPVVSAAESSTVAQNIVIRTNQYRSQLGLGNLSENESLNAAAKDKLDDMFAKNYWDHNGPNGETVWQFIDKEGYSYKLAGENLSRGYNNSEEVVEAWMASPTHRENILNSRFSEIGIAVGSGKIDGKSTTLIVQLFGEPKTLFATANSKTLVGPKSVRAEVSLANVTTPSRMPFFALWLVIFGLIITDGILIRRLGLQHSSKHLFSFRFALVMAAMSLGIMMLGFAAIA